MNINQENINLILNKYALFVDSLCQKKEYHPNVKHLLYVIISAFVVKYGISQERMILKCFESTDIIVTDNKNKNISAYFTRNLNFRMVDGNKEYYSEKYVVINNFNNTLYLDMIDSIVHEFNHAVNSMNNEILYDENYVSLRTGLSYVKYLKTDLNNAVSKDESSILEEIINTKQTEEIINIMINFSNYDIENAEISNIVKGLNAENGNKLYNSNAYFLQSYICKQLVQNRTFISTIEKLRSDGNVEYIDEWFDNILGEKGKYRELYMLLDEILKLEIKYSESKIFKNHKLSRIRLKSKMLLSIVNKFNNNCVLN